MGWGVQVITSAEFHPLACNLFAYSSSKGCIRMADLRGSALCDKQAKAFEVTEHPVRTCPAHFTTGPHCT